MKKSSIKSLVSCAKRGFWVLFAAAVLSGCTKVGHGYISSGMLYLTSTFTFQQGMVSTSYGLNPNGTTTPYIVKWTHIYDANGNIVDTLFTKTYPTGVWSAPYNSATDTSYALIMAKRTTVNLPAITLDSSSGIFTSTPASINLPIGLYSVDIQVTNAQGTVNVPKAMYFNVEAAIPIQTPVTTAGSLGTYSTGRLIANTASGVSNSTISSFNGVNNPFIVETITRFADTPNLFILKVVDKNGKVFNAGAGEFMKRPQSGLNPNPPFLQNLQYYAPDTYNEPDSGTQNLIYPIVPFPMAPMVLNGGANGYNMYYRIPTAYAQIDSTSAWASNATAGNYYQGTADPHYLGVIQNGLYDYSIRIPLRIAVPGAYEMTVKILDVTHR